MASRKHSRKRSRKSIRVRDRYGHTHVVPTHRHRRAAYTRKAYTRKDGTRVKRSRVQSHVITTRGKHSKVRIPKPKPGELRQFGYSMKKSATSRHHALERAIRDLSYASVVRHLNEIAILMRNANPGGAETARADMAWLKKTYRR